MSQLNTGPSVSSVPPAVTDANDVQAAGSTATTAPALTTQSQQPPHDIGQQIPATQGNDQQQATPAPAPAPAPEPEPTPVPTQPPSNQEERDLIKPIIAKQMKEGDTWCVVNSQWLRRWKNYVQYEHYFTSVFQYLH